jgi:hypothetical protein
VLGGGKNQDAISTIRQTTKKAADEIVDRTSHNPYRISMTTNDFGWGSNGVAANYGMLLLVANAIRPDAHYVETRRIIFTTYLDETRFRFHGSHRLARTPSVIPITGQARPPKTLGRGLDCFPVVQIEIVKTPR